MILPISGQWPFQEPKLEVPTKHKAQISGKIRIFPPKYGQKHGTSPYLYLLDPGQFPAHLGNNIFQRSRQSTRLTFRPAPPLPVPNFPARVACSWARPRAQRDPTRPGAVGVIFRSWKTLKNVDIFIGSGIWDRIESDFETKNSKYGDFKWWANGIWARNTVIFWWHDRIFVSLVYGT